MKELFSLILIFFFTANLYSQESIIKIYASDDIGNTDTLAFGLKDNTQIGIDDSLGEANIFGLPLQALDIRIRQRDAASFSCGRIESLNENIYWPENIESKIDFRPYEGFSGYQNNTFEVFIHSENYPVYITIDNSEIGFLNNNILLTRKDSNCFEDLIIGTITSDQNNMFEETDATSPVLFFSFESFDIDAYTVNTIEESISKQQIINIYPNPVSNKLNIESIFSGEVRLYDTFGQHIYTNQVNKGSSNLDISLISTGLYYMYFWSEQEGISTVRKIIKR